MGVNEHFSGCCVAGCILPGAQTVEGIGVLCKDHALDLRYELEGDFIGADPDPGHVLFQKMQHSPPPMFLDMRFM